MVRQQCLERGLWIHSMESNVCVCLCPQDWASTWSNSFFCLNRSPSASAMIRKSFLSSPSCFSMNCLVSRACCLSFCSSAWQRVKDTDKFHSITAKTRTTGPRFRCTLVLLLFFTEASFNMACSLSQEKQAKHTHTQTVKKCALQWSCLFWVVPLRDFYHFLCLSNRSYISIQQHFLSSQLNTRRT